MRAVTHISDSSSVRDDMLPVAHISVLLTTQVMSSRRAAAVGTVWAFGTPSSERWNTLVTQAALDQPQFVCAMCYHYIWVTLTLLSARVFQVYLILASQLLVTTAIVAVFTFVWVYRVCVLCACSCLCLCVTVPLFLTGILSETSYSETKLSTGHHSKSHSAVPSLPF